MPRISARHTAQLRNAGEHVSQQTRCPQGRNTVLTSLSMHTLHVLASRRRLFSSNSAKHSDTTHDKNTMHTWYFKLFVTHDLSPRFQTVLSFDSDVSPCPCSQVKDCLRTQVKSLSCPWHSSSCWHHCLLLLETDIAATKSFCDRVSCDNTQLTFSPH